MKLKLLDLNNFAKELPEITSPKIVEYGKFSKDGLFSQQIFGPVKSYYCACNRSTYKGRTSDDFRCKFCGVEITSSEERRKRFAKIKLPFQVINPLFFNIIITYWSAAKKPILEMLLHEGKYFFNDKGFLEKYNEYEPQEGVDEDLLLSGLEGALVYIEYLIEIDDKPQIQFLKSYKDNITTDVILVIPPDFRPSGKNENGTTIYDEINELYKSIITRSNHVKNIPFAIDNSNEIYRTNFRYLQQSVLKLYDYIFSKLSKKNGLIRSHILGKRVDFSGRAVISPNPNLKLNECKVPYTMLMELMKPQLITYLVNRKICSRYNQAATLIDDCIAVKDTRLFRVVEDFCKGKICVLNRQPTLHRLGMLGFKMNIHMGNTIQIHPMVCPPFNADYDGDSFLGRVNINFPCDKAESMNVNSNSPLLTIDVRDLQYDSKLFTFESEKTNDDGVTVKTYTPNEDMEIMAIDRETGNYEPKKILNYTVHENINMYKVNDPSGRFDTFWASEDHSLLVYNENTGNIERSTPKELIEDPHGKFLMKHDR